MLDQFELTTGERKILHLMARGYMNKQIARDQGVTEQVVKNHVSKIFRKLGATNRLDAVIKASQRGIVQI